MVGSKRPWRLTHGQQWPEHQAHAPAPPLGTHPAPPGAGIGPTIQIGEETVITVDTKAAGKGKVTCTVCTPDGSEVDVDVVENEDGTFDIFYTAPQPGKYVICVRFGGEHVPNSPFQVTVRRDQGWGGLGGDLARRPHGAHRYGQPQALCLALQALAGEQPTAQPPLRPQQLAPPYTYAQGGQQTWVWLALPPPSSPCPRGHLQTGQLGVP